MPSLVSKFLRYALTRQLTRARRGGLDLTKRRQLAETFADKITPPPGLYVETLSANGIPCEWVKTARSASSPTVLYLHGGAYTYGSLHSHRTLAANVADAAAGRALAVDYRLAPEHPFPAALDDVLSAYEWLLKRVKPGQIVFAGDSAGGGLALAALLKLREDKLPQPVAAVLYCPWVDLTCQSASYDARAAYDPILTKPDLLEAAAWYCQRADPTNPFASPLLADLRGLPPLLIQVSTHDLLYDEGKLLAEKVTQAGGSATLTEWPGMLHAWQFFGQRLPEARQALQQTGAFIQRHVR